MNQSKNPTAKESNYVAEITKVENSENFLKQREIKSHDLSSVDGESLNDENSENYGNYKTGRWQPSEHFRFIKGCLLHGNNWKKVKDCVKSRSSAQIRSHAQKYIIKLCKKFNLQDNKQLKSFKNIKKKFCSDSLSNLKFESGEFSNLSGSNIEQIEEIILRIFKSNLNERKLDLIQKPENLETFYPEDKKIRVFKTVKHSRYKKVRNNPKIHGNKENKSNQINNNIFSLGGFNQELLPEQIQLLMNNSIFGGEQAIYDNLNQILNIQNGNIGKSDSTLLNLMMANNLNPNDELLNSFIKAKNEDIFESLSKNSNLSMPNLPIQLMNLSHLSNLPLNLSNLPLNLSNLPLNLPNLPLNLPNLPSNLPNLTNYSNEGQVNNLDNLSEVLLNMLIPRNRQNLNDNMIHSMMFPEFNVNNYQNLQNSLQNNLHNYQQNTQQANVFQDNLKNIQETLSNKNGLLANNSDNNFNKVNSNMNCNMQGSAPDQESDANLQNFQSMLQFSDLFKLINTSNKSELNQDCFPADNTNNSNNNEKKGDYDKDDNVQLNMQNITNISNNNSNEEIPISLLLNLLNASNNSMEMNNLYQLYDLNRLEAQIKDQIPTPTLDYNTKSIKNNLNDKDLPQTINKNSDVQNQINQNYHSNNFFPISDPILGLMNQFLIPQNPAIDNSNTYNSFATNKSSYMNNLNLMDFQNNNTFNTGSINSNNNSVGNSELTRKLL